MTTPLPENAIAIIGLAGRFPDAANVEEFWQNIRAGVESVRAFTDDELTAAGEPLHPQRYAPNYVRARAALPDRAMFDAKFFGYPPREAEQMDPQQRLFLETSWEALENAGYDSERYAGAIGVYAGCYMDSYIFSNLCAQPGFLKDFTVDLQVGPLGPELSNDKDHIATRVAFKLNLHGPAINVQTACSTSLVAVAQAVQALLTFQCDMALAGGATLAFRHATGYLHQEGGMLSSDGHCRAYDERATGTVFGEGVACVVLKRLEDAVADGDHITAVIRAAALNNDGAAKVSYAAPSVTGQTEVIALAHAIADVDPATIQYVEGHGTGTPLGDPIEVAALTEAFRGATDKTGFCALGSVKPNIGHLDTASGVAGLIKTALALRERIIPPLINFAQPNPQIDFANSPFYLPTQAQPWPQDGETPRRAAVSSFGVGGTNAHVVLEEAPTTAMHPPSTAPQVLILSAKSPTALDALTARLAAHLRASSDLPLAHVAHTLQVGRREFNVRRTLVARDTADALTALEGGDAKRLPTVNQDRRNSPVIFMFPGQGSQYVGMGAELYRSQPVFRAEMDRCAEILKPHLGFDLREAIYGHGENAAAQLTQTRITQPALFATEYALARQWMAWGIVPAAMIGHSVGEYVAGCLAGVFSLEDALFLVAARARLVQEMPPGAMLAVRLPEAEVLPLLDPALSLAAVNSPNLCVAAGPFPQIEALETKLAAQGIAARRLHTSHGFHSAMMDPVVAPFAEILRGVALHPPAIPYVSNVTGRWITAAEATDPSYWAAHVRQAVRFADGIGTLLADPDFIFLETGPGTTLNTLTRQHPSKTSSRVILSSLPASSDGAAEIDTLLASLGQFWLAGCPIEWTRLTAHEFPRRVPLPAYPFERKKYWLEPVPFNAASVANAPLPEVSAPVAQPLLNLPPEPAMTPIPRRDAILTELKRILYNLSGIELADSDLSVSFLELGFDSLLLTQARQSLQTGLGVKVTFRQLMDDFGCLETLANHVDSVLPSDAFAAPAPAAAPAPLPVSQPAANGSLTVEQLITQQLQIMQQQLAALRGGSSTGILPLGPAGVPPAEASHRRQDARAPHSQDGCATKPAAHGPFKPQDRGRADGLTPHQQAALDRLVARYNARTAKSKALTQKHRRHFCDPRAAGNFRQLWKEMVYPIACARSKGSKIWDIDGNEYIDVTLGFGVHFLGHSPDFVIQAVQEQLAKGTEIGPQSPLAGEVAQMITEFSGMERVTFCNTGSEAVMAAMRVARTVTGRNKIAMFSGDYHGMFDSVLVRGFKAGGQWKTAPIAPGIPQSQVEDMVVLELNNPESLDYLRAHASEIAAVIVEPVQARNPDVQPREFLHALRDLTRETGMVYVFDEVITGFRCAPGGAQEYFGVRADLATYGKIVGGGIPIGVLAGKAEFMDVLDGGHWQYGDDSFPEVGVTFFAGTFVRHPLAMAAAHAVLRHLKQEGPALQQRISEKAATLVQRLNALFREQGVPMSLMNFCSLMHYELDVKWEFGGLLFYYLRDAGVHIWEGRLGFISCAHTDEDLAALYEGFRKAVVEMKEAGFLPGGPSDPGPRGLADTAPLTAAQQEIWTTTQLTPEATNAYNESNTLTLRGPLDVPKLHTALQCVIARHDALRATFAADASGQIFSADLHIELPLHDLTLPLAEREEKARAIVAADLATRFDLARGPLLRTHLIRLSADEHRLLITAHHLVCDGWSFDVVQSELAEIYSCLVRGAPPGLAPPPRFADFARWEVAQRTAPETSADEAFWMEKFAILPEPIQLPGDRPHPLDRSYRGAREEFALPAEFTKSLTKLGGQNGCTLFAVMLAGFAALLHRLSGASDLVIGISSAGQNLAEAPGLVGHCVNVLPFRVQTSADAPVRGLLHAVRDAMFELLEHPRVSFGRLVQRLAISREPGRVPLVPIIFNLDPSLRDLRFEGLTHETATSPRQAYQFDLGLNVVATKAGLRIECDYNTDLFDAATIQRWLTHYRTLLESMVADAMQPVQTLPLLTVAEREQITVAWNRTERPYPQDQTVAEVFAACVAQTPEAVAVIDGETRVTYADLDRRAAAVAHSLRSSGLQPGEFVGLHAERSLDFVVGVLGIVQAGGAYIPLDPTEPAERRATMRSACAQVLGETADGAGGTPAPLPTADSPAYVLFTSGSTGVPKGVIVPHRAINRLVVNNDFAPFTASDVVAFASNVCFDAATLEIWGALLNGGTLVITPHDALLSPTALAAHLTEHRVTVLFLTTSLFNRLAHEAPAMFRGLRHLIFGGEAADAASVRLVLEHGKPQRLINGYGPTETTTFAICHNVETVDGASVPIGRPIANTTVYLLDGARQPVPVGVPGEIFIGGPGVALGYLDAPGLTAERFGQTPFGRLYKTGDLAKWRADGVIEYLGRADGQIKLRGFRIEPGEIETALQRHPGIRQAAISVRDGGTGKALVGYLVGNATAAPGAAELRDFLTRSLPAPMIPRSFVWLDALPLTPHGKLDHRALPAPETAPTEASPARDHLDPRNAVERSIADLWKKILGRNSFSIRDDFFAVGGHSLLAIQVIVGLREKFGVDVPVRRLFDTPTIEGIAEFIAEHLPPPPPAKALRSLIAIQRGEETKRPLFLIPGGWGAEIEFLVYAQLKLHLGADLPIYGLKARGSDGIEEPHRSVREMVVDYVDELRTRQPHGPYLLAGECVGGVLAYEMARRLEELGEKVELLALLDTERPSSAALQRFCHEERTERWNGFWTVHVSQPFHDHMENIARLPLGRKLGYIWQRATRKRGRAAVQDTTATPLDTRKVLRHYPRLLMAHPIGAYSGKVTLLIDETSHRAQDHLAWDKVPTGGLEIHVLPGDHLSYIRENAAVTAGKLRELIDHANQVPA